MNHYFVQVLDFPGAYRTTPRHLNNKGQVVGDASSNDFPMITKAVRWDAQAATEIVGDSFTSPRAESINDAGDVLVSGLFRSILLRNETLIASPEINDWIVFPRDINNAGLVTGLGGPHYTDLSTFIYDSQDDRTPVRIPSPPGMPLVGSAINNKGQAILATPYPPSDSTMYLYANNELTPLGEARMACDINDNAHIVGSRLFPGNPQPTAFYFDASRGTGGFTDLGALAPQGHISSTAMGINNQGDIVGSSSAGPESASAPSAFICRNGAAMTDLNTCIPRESGWQLHCAVGVNDRGQIAGYGNYYGSARGFLLTPARILPKDGPFAGIEYNRLVGDLTSLAFGSAGIYQGPGTRPIPIDPEGHLWQELSPAKRDIVLALAMTELSSKLHDRRANDELEKAVRGVIQRALEHLFKP